MKEKVALMDKCVRCLALELPEAVHEDVKRIWNDLKALRKNRGFQLGLSTLSSGGRKACGESVSPLNACGLKAFSINQEENLKSNVVRFL